jgi:ribose transport system substrate-binding protein
MKKAYGALAALLLTTSLSSHAFADGETIAVFTKNQTNPYFQTVRVGSDAAAKAMKAKTLHYIPTKPDSIPEQLSQIEDVVVKKPSAASSSSRSTTRRWSPASRRSTTQRSRSST